ncbi:hypothetical protein TNCV_1698721 [Trichonephila clavipes]|nr:hypothetical protein TNCV_1698721 [Trichonephila clavipes]
MSSGVTEKIRAPLQSKVLDPNPKYVLGVSQGLPPPIAGVKLLIGDRRPSELLRVLRRRVESHIVPDELMLELFLQHLPTRVQSILEAISPLTLEKVADRVMEVTPIAKIFPDITKPLRPDQEIKHSVVHYIETTGRPVIAVARSRSSPHRKSGISEHN